MSEAQPVRFRRLDEDQECAFVPRVRAVDECPVQHRYLREHGRADLAFDHGAELLSAQQQCSTVGDGDGRLECLHSYGGQLHEGLVLWRHAAAGDDVCGVIREEDQIHEFLHLWCDAQRDVSPVGRDRAVDPQERARSDIVDVIVEGNGIFRNVRLDAGDVRL